MQPERPNSKIQVTLPADVADRIRKLAEIIGATESRMAALLLEASVSDVIWFQNWMSAKVAQGVKALKGSSKTPKR